MLFRSAGGSGREEGAGDMDKLGQMAKGLLKGNLLKKKKKPSENSKPSASKEDEANLGGGSVAVVGGGGSGGGGGGSSIKEQEGSGIASGNGAAAPAPANTSTPALAGSPPHRHTISVPKKDLPPVPGGPPKPTPDNSSKKRLPPFPQLPTAPKPAPSNTTDSPSSPRGGGGGGGGDSASAGVDGGAEVKKQATVFNYDEEAQRDGGDEVYVAEVLELQEKETRFDKAKDKMKDKLLNVKKPRTTWFHEEGKDKEKEKDKDKEREKEREKDAGTDGKKKRVAGLFAKKSGHDDVVISRAEGDAPFGITPGSPRQRAATVASQSPAHDTTASN